MKHRLITALTLLLLAFHLPLLAQAYRQLPPTGARWKINFHCKNTPTDIGSFWMTTDGNTTVAGYPVTRLVVGQAAACSGWALSCFINALNYIHQDSLGRGYLVQPNGQTTKLYDLGLQVGDTMQTTDQWGTPLHYRVDSIATLQFADCLPRKALYISMNSPSAVAFFSPVVWVEGIGDIYNGPIPVPGVESWHEAACYREEELILVTNPYVGSCINDCDRLVAVEPRLPRLPAVTVSPNPAHSRLRITHAAALPLHVRLLALDGRTLGAWELAGTTTHTLNLPEVGPGLYLLEVRDAGGSLHT
jgi:hypothetical protein